MLNQQKSAKKQNLTDDPAYYRNKMREMRRKRAAADPLYWKKRVWVVEGADGKKFAFLNRADVNKAIHPVYLKDIDIENDKDYVKCF